MHARHVITVMIAAVFCDPLSAAQGALNQLRLSPQEAEAAWNIEADHAAVRMKLDETATAKLRSAFRDSRTEFYREFLPKLKDLGSRNQGSQGERLQEFSKLHAESTKSAADTLKKVLNTFLVETQSAEALRLLGSYNIQWDKMVHTVHGFNLGEDKETKALGAISDYVSGFAPLEERLGSARPGVVLRQAGQLRDTLEKDLESILSAEQMAVWRKELPRLAVRPGA